MADITKVTVGSTTYNIKDANAVRDYAGRIFYGTCETAKATTAKVATLVDSTGFSLTKGVVVAIKFSYSSTTGPMTLSVNNTTACTIKQYGTQDASGGSTTAGWYSGSIVILIFDGTYWVRSYWYNTTYNTMSQNEADTGTNTDARTITAKILADTIANKTSGKEVTTNKVTSLSSSSTDTEYPSAKCVYDLVGNVETLLASL